MLFIEKVSYLKLLSIFKVQCHYMGIYVSNIAEISGLIKYIQHFGPTKQHIHKQQGRLNSVQCGCELCEASQNLVITVRLPGFGLSCLHSVQRPKPLQTLAYLTTCVISGDTSLKYWTDG